MGKGKKDKRFLREKRKTSFFLTQHIKPLKIPKP